MHQSHSVRCAPPARGASSRPMEAAQATKQPDTIPAVTATKPPAKLANVTGKVAVAIAAMVWDGLPRKKAAEKAAISEHGLYKALRKPYVKAHYLAELEVLRTSERARNIHTLAEVRDQTSNQMARVQAVKALEQIDDAAEHRPAAAALPGMQIVIITGQVTNDSHTHQTLIQKTALMGHE